MKIRHVFSAPDMETARHAIAAAKSAGVDDQDVLLVARSDIESSEVPDNRKEVDTDLLPAAARGAGYGAGAGLLAGLAAVAIPPLGITMAGAAAATIAGAVVGSWSAALMGSALPDPVRQQFDDEISAGRILVVVDGSQQVQEIAEPAIVSAGAKRLPFESPTAMT